MVDKHEQIIRVWGIRNRHFTIKRVQSCISHDVIFRSGLLTRESPNKSKQVDSEFVTI